MPSDDLSDLIVPHWTQGAPATPRLGGPPGRPASYGQGVIVEWDSETFENVVRFHGTELHDLPVMAGADALTFTPGDVVGIQYWAPEGGSGQYWILPRIIVPGSGAAEQAIAMMRTSLGRAVALGVIGQAIRVESTFSQAFFTADSGGFVSHPQGGGPVLTDVNVGETGRCLVMISAAIGTTATDESSTTSIRGDCGLDITGATTVAPILLGAASMGNSLLSVVGATSWSTGHGQAATFAQLIEGLNQGAHTMEVVYNVEMSASDGSCSFSGISIVAIPF